MKNLFDRLQECQREGLRGIPMDELLIYMEDAARAIDYLNRRTHLVGSTSVGIQHCDVKPHNTLLVGGVVQVCDLGVARVLEDNRTSVATGSAAYIAPEFIRHNKPSAATDQYSLAITYIELRTGALPFQARTAATAYLIHLNGELDLAAMTAAEREVLVRATAVDPGSRYPSCAEFVKQLREAYALIPPEERAVVAGVARLNASGIVADSAADSNLLPDFGPVSTGAMEDQGEEPARSDEDEASSIFAEAPTNSSPATDLDQDNIPTLVCIGPALTKTPPRAEPVWPMSRPPEPQWFDQTWSRISSRWRAASPAGDGADRMSEPFRPDLDPGTPSMADSKHRNHRLGAESRRYVRYAVLVGLVIAMGVLAGLGASSYRAAEQRAANNERSARRCHAPDLAARQATAPADESLAEAWKLREQGRRRGLEGGNRAHPGRSQESFPLSISCRDRNGIGPICGSLGRHGPDARKGPRQPGGFRLSRPDQLSPGRLSASR